MEKIKNLFNKLLCLHSWKLEQKHNVYAYEDDKFPTYEKRLYICEKCGKFKKVEL